MRALLLLFLAVHAGAIALAQLPKDTIESREENLDSIVVYANKFAERAKRVAQTVTVINSPTALQNQPNTGDVLINTGQVFVQKSQQGGGSPVIRGFEASRILLMVDGVRMNNAIYRAGHLQNIISVDNAILDRIEVLYGPSSTLYGSDALGGVVSLYTRSPKLFNSTKTQASGTASVRVATATEEFRAHGSVNLGGSQWASLTAFTYSVFGNVTQGRQRPGKYREFGKIPFVVVNLRNRDTAILNNNPDKQQPAGYKQWDVLQKLLFKPNNNISHILNIQYSTTSNIPRFDRLSEMSNGLPAFAEWYYGPQTRSLFAYQFFADNMSAFFRQVQVNASYQRVEESRYSRRFAAHRRDERIEQVDVYAVNLDAKHYAGRHELHVGWESNINYIHSAAQGRNRLNGALSRISTRYPDGFNRMGYHAIYAQHTLKFNDRLTLNDGLRLNYVGLQANFADTSLMHFPFKQVLQQNLAASGNLGLVYATRKNLKLAILFNTGFRSPNVDDLAKVFDSRAGVVVVPNPFIKPEYTYNLEFNINQYVNKLRFGAAVYHTWFVNAIVTDAFNFNGKDSIIYDGVNSLVLANQNKARANTWGFSTNLAYLFTKTVSVSGVVTYTRGRYFNNGKAVPMDHIPPVHGRVAATCKRAKWQAEAFMLFNGWKHIKDYSPSGEDNPQYATPEGMPAWYTLNFRGQLTILKSLELHLIVENILDRNYRYFASGISAPGRNIAVTVKYSFK